MKCSAGTLAFAVSAVFFTVLSMTWEMHVPVKDLSRIWTMDGEEITVESKATNMTCSLSCAFARTFPSWCRGSAHLHLMATIKHVNIKSSSIQLQWSNDKMAIHFGSLLVYDHAVQGIVLPIDVNLSLDRKKASLVIGLETTDSVTFVRRSAFLATFGRTQDQQSFHGSGWIHLNVLAAFVRVLDFAKPVSVSQSTVDALWTITKWMALISEIPFSISDDRVRISTLELPIPPIILNATKTLFLS